ncbi:hypothetical protein Tco_1197124 [Tanacetum coccineum]
MNTRSTGQEPTTPYSKPERFIHRTKKKKKIRKPFIPVEDRIPKGKYLPLENLFKALVVYNPFLDLPFPMADNQPMWGNYRAVAPTPEAAIVAVDLGDNFTIKDAIKLKLFPTSLAGDAKVWFNELSPNVIATWEQIRQAFDLLRSCHGHDLRRGTIIQIFYHNPNLLYKTPNKAHQLLEDLVLLKLDWSKDIKAKPIRKTVAFVERSNDSKLMEKMEALTTKIDLQLKDIKG